MLTLNFEISLLFEWEKKKNYFFEILEERPLKYGTEELYLKCQEFDSRKEYALVLSVKLNKFSAF